MRDEAGHRSGAKCGGGYSVAPLILVRQHCDNVRQSWLDLLRQRRRKLPRETWRLRLPTAGLVLFHFDADAGSG
jgi:hypothetical protein